MTYHIPHIIEHFISGHLEKKSPPNREIFLDWTYPFQTILSNFGFSWQKSPPLLIREIFLDWIYPSQTISSNFGFGWQKSPPSFLPFRERPGSQHTCRIPMVPIVQIHTQIPPIQISSLGYQLYQLFKILTHTEVQDTGSWCRWKPYRQPYHNTH